VPLILFNRSTIIKLPGRLPVSNKALASITGLVIIVSPPWTSGSIVFPLLCIGGGFISREVSRRGAALSHVVIVCLHFETVTFRYSVSSVSMIVDDTIRG
jgi:hypothetical protein